MKWKVDLEYMINVQNLWSVLGKFSSFQMSITEKFQILVEIFTPELH